MTTLNLRRLRLRPGEEYRDEVELELEPIVLGGQRYVPVPERVPAVLRIVRATTGTTLDLALAVRLHGPCFRCLAETALDLPVAGSEYQASDPAADEELRSPYVADDVVDLSAWARDAVVLALPDKILCRPDCAGLCPVCGKNLNEEPHLHEEPESDPRWAALENLRSEI